MDLHVHYNNESCSQEQIVSVEHIYQERLLDLFQTPERAYEAHEEWCRNGKPAVCKWSTYNRIADMSATAPLSPSLRALGHPRVAFDK